MNKEREVIKILKDNEIDLVTTLPCGKIKYLLQLVHSDPEFHDIPLNKEEDGVCICAGAYLAGGKPAMIIQSSGLGNCFNALLSLSVTFELPLPIITSWRGVYKEEIPAQIPFNKDLPKVLHAWNIPHKIIENPSEIDLLEDIIMYAYENNTPSVALISPETWEEVEEREDKIVEQSFPKREKKTNVRYEKNIHEPGMTRYDAIKTIAEYLDEEAVVSNIGIPSKELYDVKDRERNFYMLGSYSQASSIGLGMALKTKRETVVLDGDGSLLATSVLPTIAAERPKNLSIFCLDNGTLGSTGDQLTNAYSGVDVELMAIISGIKETKKVHTEKELRSTIEGLYDNKGPRFIHVIVKPGNVPSVANIKLTPEQIKKRFMKAML
uniref:sulfopyruvate decarboxylase n=1 Tax=Candidatus Methanophagaceae archaeon ANME-1 ERB6 TaxID=2759912 RepID=A0A7G9YVC7_9EURY|nr:sulfopyruvate decarboxylase [Methanosarcinales archaeon ANME-1 ERB6]